MKTQDDVTRRTFMEKNWTDKNVDLARFTTHVGEFFKKYDFEAVKEKLENGWRIEAQDSPIFKMEGLVTVTIEGDPNNLKVTLDRSGIEKKSHINSMYLTAAFGGGYFLLKRMKSEENWTLFQRQFWRYVENSIDLHNY
jgi:DNA-binding protein YbaB